MHTYAYAYFALCRTVEASTDEVNANDRFTRFGQIEEGGGWAGGVVDGREGVWRWCGRVVRGKESSDCRFEPQIEQYPALWVSSGCNPAQAVTGM